MAARYRPASPEDAVLAPRSRTVVYSVQSQTLRDLEDVLFEYLRAAGIRCNETVLESVHHTSIKARYSQIDIGGLFLKLEEYRRAFLGPTSVHPLHGSLFR